MDYGSDLSPSQNGVVLNESFTALNKAWCTETNASDILPFQAEIVEELQGQLTDQQELIDQKVEDGREEEYFAISLYQMDIERVRYSLARYLRTRILKIERNLEYILSSIDVMDRLSMNEKVFATKLNNLNNIYFEDNVTNRIQQQDAREMYDLSDNRLRDAQPHDKNFVFCRACVDLRDLPVSVDQAYTMWRGDIGILQYSIIKDYVSSGQAELL